MARIGAKGEADAERVRIHERLTEEHVVFNSAAPLDRDAAHWFTRAADRQHIGAAYELGLAKLLGRGCNREIDEGFTSIGTPASPF